ncbi:hypothetical protein V8C43DRAFT_175192 [Trichoderma afarasin]
MADEFVYKGKFDLFCISLRVKDIQFWRLDILHLRLLAPLRLYLQDRASCLSIKLRCRSCVLYSFHNSHRNLSRSLALSLNTTDSCLQLHVMPIKVVLGAQWGDEGKGKLVDILAPEAQLW